MIKDSAIVVQGAKGQIVISKPIRRELAITPSTKLTVYRKDDKIVLVKFNNLPLVEVKGEFKIAYEETPNIKAEKEQGMGQTEIKEKTFKKSKQKRLKSRTKKNKSKKSL